MMRPLVLSLCAALTLSACDRAVDEEIEEEAPAPLAVGGGWSSQDIGAVAAAGSDTLVNGVHTVKASGADIYGTADEFHFVYRLVLGDTTVVARVTSLQNTNSSAKAVVMIRESLDAGSRFVASELTPVATNRYRQHSRSTTKGTAVLTKATVNSAIPSWLRVVRKGSTFTTSYSTNGTTWKTVGVALTVSMAKAVYVGFGATSHLDGTLATAKFDKAGFTGTAVECSPGAAKCSDLSPVVCSSAGVWVQAAEHCPFECSAGRCIGECSSNTTRCAADGTIQLCQNYTWTTSSQSFVCLATDLFACANGAVQHKCGTECGSIDCGYDRCESLTEPYLCVVDPPEPGNPPPSGDRCSIQVLGAGAFPCEANPAGTWCDTGQTYLYQYRNTAPNAYSLVTDRYYVCDGNHWLLGG
jgi:hypothetical protein